LKCSGTEILEWTTLLLWLAGSPLPEGEGLGVRALRSLSHHHASITTTTNSPNGYLNHSVHAHNAPARNAHHAARRPPSAALKAQAIAPTIGSRAMPSFCVSVQKVSV